MVRSGGRRTDHCQQQRVLPAGRRRWNRHLLSNGATERTVRRGRPTRTFTGTLVRLVPGVLSVLPGAPANGAATAGLHRRSILQVTWFPQSAFLLDRGNVS